MTTACKEKIDEICQKLESLGLMKTVNQGYEGGFTFIDPKCSIDTYLGTYLNPFSCIEVPGKELKFLWQDVIAREYASITVAPLYRHNGTDEDANAVIRVYHFHSSIFKVPVSDHDLKNQIFVNEAKKSPTDFMKNGELFASTCGTQVFKKKVSYLAKTKATDNAIKAAVEAFNSYVPNDHSQFKQDPSNYMKPTSQN